MKSIICDQLLSRPQYVENFRMNNIDTLWSLDLVKTLKEPVQGKIIDKLKSYRSPMRDLDLKHKRK
jgi:hypothetical protein